MGPEGRDPSADWLHHERDLSLWERFMVRYAVLNRGTIVLIKAVWLNIENLMISYDPYDLYDLAGIPVRNTRTRRITLVP